MDIIRVESRVAMELIAERVESFEDLIFIECTYRIQLC